MLYNKYVSHYLLDVIHLTIINIYLQVVREVFNVLVPYTRKLYCAEKDGQFCAIRFPEILSPNVRYNYSICVIPLYHCSRMMTGATGQYRIVGASSRHSATEVVYMYVC